MDVTGEPEASNAEWRWEAGRVVHQCGLAFERDPEQGWTTSDESMAVWQAAQVAKGATVMTLVPRVLQLTREAAQWSAQNPPE